MPVARTITRAGIDFAVDRDSGKFTLTEEAQWRTRVAVISRAVKDKVAVASKADRNRVAVISKDRVAAASKAVVNKVGSKADRNRVAVVSKAEENRAVASVINSGGPGCYPVPINYRIGEQPRISTRTVS